jgi:hypothetical protein
MHRAPAIPVELEASWQTVLRSMTARLPADRISAEDVATCLLPWVRVDGPAQALTTSKGATEDATVQIRQPGAGDTEVLDPTAIAPERTELAPVGQVAVARDVPPARGGRALVVALGILVLGLLVGLSVLLLTSAPHRSGAPGSSTTSSTTATTTTTTTTTTLPTPSVASAAGALDTAVNAGVANGSVAPQAGQQLANQLQPLLFSPHAESTQQQTQQFDQVVLTFDMDVANGQITGKATVAALTRSIDGLASALGTTVPTSTVPSKPGPPGGPGKGHGKGKGNGNGNGNGN